MKNNLIMIKKKKNYIDRRVTILSVFLGIIAFILSLYFIDIYVGGDPFYYIQFYEGVSDFNISDAYNFYVNTLGAREPVYFILIYLISNFVSRTLFMSMINGYFMFLLSKILLKRGVSIFFVLLLLSNFYILVLFFSAERLKFSMLFFLIFLIYLNKKSKYFFLLLSILTHTQSLLLLASVYIDIFIKWIKNIILKKQIKNFFYIVLCLIGLFIVYMILENNIINKTDAYTVKRGVDNLIKPIIFMLFSMLVLKRRLFKIFIMFSPLLIGSYLYGEERIVIFSYFLFLALSFSNNKRLNLYIILTSIYFGYKGIDFLNNIIIFKNGFYIK